MTVVDDVNVAALASLKGLRVKPFRKNSHRVAFRIEGDFELVMQSLMEDKPVPIQSFLSTLRMMRSNLFMMKNSGDGNGHEKKDPI